MKENIFIEISEAKFCKLCYWSNWVDIGIFNFGSGSYLLQMKVNRFGKKKFRDSALKSKFVAEHAMYGTLQGYRK